MKFVPTDPLYPLFSIFAFFSFFLPLIPLTWHLQAWNLGACFYMMWASLLGLIQFVDSIIWAGTVLDLAPIWCDITTHVYQAACFAIPLSSLCIVRRLYLISSLKTALTRLEQRRAMIFDIFVCFIMPLALLALQYVSQGRRYEIWEEVGCRIHMDRTLAMPFIINVPIIATGLVSMVYDVLCIRALFQHLRKRKELSKSVPSSAFTYDRYIPIVTLAFLEMACTTPIATCALIFNIELGLEPWISWDYVHGYFDYIEMIPSPVWKSQDLVRNAIETERWVTASFGIIIFLFLGTTKEARRQYWRAYRRLRRLVGQKTTTDTPESEKSHEDDDDVPNYSSVSEPSFVLPTIIDIEQLSRVQENSYAHKPTINLEDSSILNIAR
ncbi:hypothetical protein D9757_007452 [Collybiopsis confluens]|uniref:Pheromone receptor n=1 Tax=Collybiopsis confluens TaxID=2823264 RepID=A0A8H5HJW8_9AGAR|nr:hypothetical protein D9757_007452 [Collybiopsis confluens]